MRAASCLALQALACLRVAVHGHFITSLHTNYVVNLDFESSAPGATDDAGEEGDAKVMAFAGGKRRFKCKLPRRANRTALSAGAAASAMEDDVKKSREHFLRAKMVAMTGDCWKVPQGAWTYDLCFGRTITGYRQADDMRISLGQYSPDFEELLNDGGVRQLYVGGRDNRTTELRFMCGRHAEHRAAVDLDTDPERDYRVWRVRGPQFCNWREQEGAQARDAAGEPLHVSNLLEALRGQCVNVTQGWWTYEYCYPEGLSQFHMGGNTGKREPEYSLGSVRGDSAPNRVNMTLFRMKPSISPLDRRSPPSNHRTLLQRLGEGTRCDETSRPRATSMLFRCPTNWQSQPVTHIASINEASLCEYQVVVHTTLLCGHEKFLPTLPRGKETIHCVAAPHDEAQE